jgi:PAS domain S-box-containing protein
MGSRDDEYDRLRAEIARLREVQATLEERVARADQELRASQTHHAALAVSDRKEVDAERDRAAFALRESEVKLRLAVQTAGIGLWSWHIHADKVVWEPELCAIFGLPPGDGPATRAAYLALLYPEDRERARRTIGDGLETGAWEGEHRILRADGAVRWVMTCGTVLHSHSAEQAVVVGAVIDVTERRERDERLRQAQKLEAVGQLTAGIAHNFNNMLMGILPNVELAARAAPAEIVPFLRNAEHSAQRAADLVRQLTTFAGRSRRQERTVEPIALLVERSVALCRTTFDQRIAFITHLESAARVRIDPGQIQQALLNLLINARDALADPSILSPHVTIDVDVVPAGAAELEGRMGDFVRVRVSDNGAGMDAATLARLYEPFFTTKEVGKGTGLGLATTHAILREHGGLISCSSEPGRGTTFALYLPNESAAADAAREVAASQAPRGTETVLVVDDEPAVRGVATEILVAAGFDVKAAASGEEAIALLSDAPTAAAVRVVLLDVSMPGMPSRDLRARLRALAPSARIVYFTGYAFDAADAEDAVLEKPVTRARLLATIRSVLDRAQVGRAQAEE